MGSVDLVDRLLRSTFSSLAPLENDSTYEVTWEGLHFSCHAADCTLIRL